MATIRCPICGHRESDGRPHDKETYPELCRLCSRQLEKELALGTPQAQVDQEELFFPIRAEEPSCES
jgi:hypothetical protein